MLVRNWRAVDFVILILTGVIASFMFSVNYNIITDPGEMNPADLKVIHNIMAGVISVVSMYVGASIQEKRDRE
jgi:hypothetical protein